jgi:thiol-disulfide isomerase/thioredoxin
MLSRIRLLLLPLFTLLALSCRMLSPQMNNVTPTTTRELAETKPADTNPTNASTNVQPSAQTLVVVDIVPGDGSLVSQLASHAQKAAGVGLKPVAEFGATWCPACVAIQQALDQGEPLMVDAFRGVYVIRIDVDLWPQGEVQGAGFDVPVIPKLFKLDRDGHPTGEVIDGDAWGENIPKNMAPPLKEFFNK